MNKSLLLVLPIIFIYGIDNAYPMMWIHFTTLINGSRVYIANPQLKTERNEEERLYYFYKMEEEKEMSLVSKMLKEEDYFTKAVGYLSVNCERPKTIYIHELKRYNENGDLEMDQVHSNNEHPVKANIDQGSVHELIVEQLCEIIKVAKETDKEIKFEGGEKLEINQQLIEDKLREKIGENKKESLPPYENAPPIKNGTSDYYNLIR
jgi:hypothetical protein